MLNLESVEVYHLVPPSLMTGVRKGKTARTFSSWRPRARTLSPQPHRSASAECQTAQQPLRCQESPSRSLSGPWSAVWWHHCANDPVWELLHGAPWLGKMEVVDIQLEGHCWWGPLTSHSLYFVDIFLLQSDAVTGRLSLTSRLKHRCCC